MVVLTLMLLSLSRAQAQPTTRGETVFHSGRIYTLNKAQPWAEAVFVKDGIIKYVGDTETAQKMATGIAEQIDLGGKMMMPGIHDVHMHPLEAASKNFQFTVDSETEDAESYGRDVDNADRDHPGEGWLLGWGHYLETVLAATRTPRAILDEAVAERPVAIMEQTSHSVWVNSKALQLLGIDASTPNPQGGIIMRDESGQPTGILVDNAGELVFQIALRPTPEKAEKDYEGLISFALPEMAKHGITSFCEARTFWKRNQQDTWKRIESEGKLTVRTNLGLWAYPAENDLTQIAKLKSLYSNKPGSLLKINEIKLYADGIVHNTTAAMTSNYLVDLYHLPTNNGINYFTEDRLKSYIEQLEPVGFHFHMHTLGNRAVHETLNAIEAGSKGKGRHRLTHCEYVDPIDYLRFAQLGVTADVQVAGDFTQPSEWHSNDHLVGSELTQNVIPLKHLHQAGARITLSSDWDVSGINPFIGIENAITRAPQEIDLETAVKAYTLNGAYAMGHEKLVGSIEEGKEADLIILNQNIFEVDQKEISETRVQATYLQGKVVYER